MYLTKSQIRSFIEKVEQPRASILLNKFFNQYRKHLRSSDVAFLYDAEYLNRISSHPVYLEVNGFPIHIYNRYAYEYIVPRIKPGCSILDIGCGNGDFCLAIASYYPVKITGVDFNKKAIEQAKAKAATTGVSSCEFYIKDVAELTSDIHYDFIVLNDITEHLADSELEYLFKTIKALLKPEGEVVIHTPNGLALCNDIDSNLFQKIYKLLKGWKGIERSLDQLYYDQVHINIKSFREFKLFLNKLGYKSWVIYDDLESYKWKFMSQLASNMLIIAKVNR